MSTKKTTSSTRTLGVALCAMAVLLVMFLMSDSETIRWAGAGAMVLGVFVCVALLGKTLRAPSH